MGLKIDRRANKIIKIILFVILAIFVIILAKIFFWEQSYYQNKTGEVRSPEQAVITDLAEAINPIEMKPTDQEYSEHQVPVTAPRYLEIQRLDLKARVTSTNVNEHTLPLPTNIYDVSWYSGSSRPGQGGNILISGISEGAYAHGVFANLDSLEQGDLITIEVGSGDRYYYEVREISIIDKADAANQLPTAQKRIDDKETLALITGRRADESSSTFNSIIMLRATKKD